MSEVSQGANWVRQRLQQFLNIAFFDRTTLSQNWLRGYSGQINPSSKMKATFAPLEQFAFFMLAIVRPLASFASFVGIVSEKVSH